MTSNWSVNDHDFDNRAVDMPMALLLGNPPKMTRDVVRMPSPESSIDLDGIDLRRGRTARAAFSGGR